MDRACIMESEERVVLTPFFLVNCTEILKFGCKVMILHLFSKLVSLLDDCNKYVNSTF